jgi:peptidoglycan-associated lipoprotein
MMMISEGHIDMRRVRNAVVIAASAMVGWWAQSCAIQSGSGTGEDRSSEEERIGEPAIKEILRQDFGGTAPNSNPTLNPEPAPRNASLVPGGAWLDVLFDFDRTLLRTDAFPILEANAKLLKGYGVSRVVLEGRGNEIGTSAYNLVLGERRARNVKTYPQQMGLSIELKTMSYGKDRPLCFEHHSACMQQNRSVRFVVKE